MGSAATPLGNMVIKLGLDDASFGKGVENSKKQIKYLAKEMQANVKIADLAGNSLGKLGTKYESLSKIIQAQEKQVAGLRKAYDESFVDGKATDSTKKFAAELQSANGRLANYKKQLIDTAGAYADLQVRTTGFTGKLNSFSKAAESAGDKIQKLGAGVSAVGSTLTTAVTLPIAAGFTYAAKQAIDFNSQLATTRALLNDGTVPAEELDKQINKLGDSSKNWAKEYGISTTSINAGMEEIIKKGYTYEQTLGAMPSILDASVASGDDFNTVMDASTSILEQFNLKADTTAGTLQNTQRVTDSLTFVANKTAAGFADIANAMEYVGPVANSAGVSLEETASAIGLLSNNGIQGEKAGTALRGALTRLLKPSKQNIEGFQKLGISSREFRDGTLTLPDMLDKIKKNTEGWTDAQRAAAIALAFGTESQSGMNILINQGGDALRGLTQETQNSAGYTKKLADQLNNTDAKKVEKFKQSVNTLAITFGQKLLPTFTPIIEKATDLIDKFSDMDEEAQMNILKWGGIALAAGPALKLLGGGINTIGKVTTGVGKLTGGLVDLAAKYASKQTIKAVVTDLTSAGSAATTAATGIGEATTAVGGLGTAATAAAGTGTSTGIGAIISGLGAVAVPALGVATTLGAVALAIYEAKKKYDDYQLAGGKWGTSVTSEQDKVLDNTYKLRDEANAAIAEYQAGVTSSADEIVKANEKIVDSIQKNIDKEYERNKSAAEGIDDEKTKAAAERGAEREKRIQESKLAQAKEYLEKNNQIARAASENNRKISAEEMAIIQQNYRTMSADQLQNLGFTKEQSLAIETSYQKDLTQNTMSENQKLLESVTKGVNDARSEYEKQRKEIENAAMTDAERTAGLDRLDESFKAKTETMIASMARLKMATGVSLEDSAGVWANYGYTVDEVRELVNNATDDTLENLDMFAKGTEEADAEWNNLALDPKTGEIKTNMADTLADMAKTDDGWNHLVFMAKNADISTNAKEEIAIAIGAADKWDLMSMEQKEAVVDGDKAKLALYELIDDVDGWNQYNADRKTLGIDNADALYKMLDTEEKIKAWNTVPTETKQLLANNQDLLTKISSSQEVYAAWASLPNNVKSLLANNEDLLAKLQSGEVALDGYNLNDPAFKTLLGDSSGIEAATAQGNASINLYSGNNPAEKKLNGNASGVSSAAAAGGQALNTFANNNPLAKTLRANDLASGPASNATRAVSDFDNKPSIITKTLKVVSDIGKGVANLFGWEKGTNYHPGGLAIVNDQVGPLYKELITLPNGKAFIPQDRNVMLDLPKGSKVLRAALTKKLFPNYADGVGIPENSTLVRNLRSVEAQQTNINIDSSGTSRQLDMLIKIMSRFGDDLKNLELKLDGRKVAEVLTKEQRRASQNKKRMAGDFS